MNGMSPAGEGREPWTFYLDNPTLFELVFGCELGLRSVWLKKTALRNVA